MNEWLELVTGVSRGALEAKDAIDGLLSEDWVTQSCGNVGKLLVLTPFNLILGTLIVIVMRGCRAVFEGLLEVVISLADKIETWLPPAMIVLEVLVIKRLIFLLRLVSLLTETRGHVALFNEVVWADLCNVKIDQERVVAVEFHQLFLVFAIDVNGCRNVDMLMGQDVLRVSVLVAWGVEVVHLQIPGSFGLIDAEVEVLLGCDFLVLAGSQLLGSELILELQLGNFLVDNFIDTFFD